MHPDSKFVKFFKFFGLAPFSSNPQTQRFLTIHSCALSLAFTLTNIYGFNLNIFGDGFAVSSMAGAIVYAFQIFAHFVILLESVKKRKNHFQIFVKTQEFDSLFRLRLLQKVDLRKYKKKLIWRYCLITSLILVTLFTFLISVLTHAPYVYGFPSILTARMRVIQAEVYLELINGRFEILHWNLKQIAECKRNKQTRFLDVDYKAIEHPNRIVALKAAYDKLHQAVECFNESFGWSMLCVVSSYFLEFTCNAYWVLLTTDSSFPNFMRLECTATIIPLSLQLGSLCYISHKCAANGTRTKELVQKMFMSLTDDPSSDLLDEILLQITLRPISIHAKQFFCLNLELLGAIFSSAISGLVILIQFVVIEHKDL